MSDADYQAFLEYLYREYMEPRIRRLKHRWDHPKRFGEWDYSQSRLRSAVRILRFAHRECEDVGEVYRSFRLERLREAVGEVGSGVRFSRHLAEEAGVLDCLDSHFDEIVEGPLAEHFPEYELEFMADLGSSTPRGDLEAIAYMLRQRTPRRHWSEERLIRHELKTTEARLEEESGAFQEDSDSGANSQSAKKSRKWFKGLGQIGQGAALTAANIGVAVGILDFPVPPETRTYGALVSATTGVGMVLIGVGELRGE